MSAGARVVTDYSSGIEAGALPNVTVIAPDAAKQRFGDPAARTSYTAAFRDALAAGPDPVLCLVGPYGYSPAFTAASGGRNDLAREQIDPNRVRVLNVGRSFLGLGALATSLTLGGLDAEAGTDWLDNAGVATHMWLVATSERLETAEAEASIEAPTGIPEEPYSLLRLRLAARVTGGFETVEEAVEAALAATPTADGGGVGFVANTSQAGSGDAWERLAPASVEWRTCALPTFLARHFGSDAFAFAVAPRASA